MTFLYSEYLLLVIVFIILISYFLLKQEKVFFSWVEDHWFYTRSKANKVGSVFFIIGICLLSLALLDLRGPEENIKGKISDQKTIILIDSSASMLAEDVRPNRFQKAVLLAKHYVKKSVGQQVSIVVFSDTTKQIIPFTNDIDLLEARLGALENMNLQRGGTSLSLAIKESMQYFKNHTKELSGNILIFTDAEETDGGIDFEIPEDITLGVIGIGTAKGAVVPIRSNKGVFIGNKKFQGKAVVSKLDESFIKSLGDKIKNFRYWIATSYTLPTEDILSFFSKINKIKQSKNNFRIQPVLSNYLMIPGVVLLILSFLFKMRQSFILPLILVCLFGTNVYSQDKEEEEPKEKSALVKALEKKFIDGAIDDNEKKALASQLLQEGFSKESEALYNEIIKENLNKENIRDYFNRGAAQFKNKKIKKGFETYKNLYDFLKENDSDSELMPEVKTNMLKALEQMASQQQQKSQKNEENENKDDQNSEDSKEGEDGEKGKEGKQKQSQNGESGEQKDQNSKQNEDSKKDKDKKKNSEKDQKNQKDNKSKKDGEDKKKKGKKKSDEKGDPQGKSKKGKKKIPALLKQLMSDDNKLQKKIIDTGTTKRKPREQKDW